MDKSSFGGVILAIGGILLGLTLEGGKIAQIMQPTAAMIVLGGTIGAVMLQFPLSVVLQAFGRLGSVFFVKNTEPSAQIEQMVAFANKARKDGVVSLDSEVQKISDPFLKKSLMLAVDGTEPHRTSKNDGTGPRQQVRARGTHP